MVDVWIAPGHGRTPRGAIDPGALAGNVSEQSAGDGIAAVVEQLLRDRFGLGVARQPRGGPNFVGSIREINAAKPKLAVELHHDWIRAPRGGFGFARTRRHFDIANAITAAYQDADLPTRAHLRALPSRTSLPSIMVQTRYPTMLWEVDRIGTSTAQGHGTAIADGIVRALRALGHTVTEPRNPKPPGWSGMQVRAKRDVRFYLAPGWYPDNPVDGVLPAGWRFAGGIHELRAVGAGEQYRVSNSKGQQRWITASDRFVELVEPR